MDICEKIIFRCTLTSTDSSIPLGVKISVDGQTIYENLHVKNKEQVEYTLSDDDSEHELVFDFFGKSTEHTTIDTNGNIINDALLIIDNFSFDNINITPVMQKLASYTHDFNGTQAPTHTKFYGALGCNGTLRLKFSTPVYLWLLEHM